MSMDRQFHLEFVIKCKVRFSNKFWDRFAHYYNGSLLDTILRCAYLL